jgi:hypothetical protein
MRGLGVFVLDVLVFVMLVLMFFELMRAVFGVVFSMFLSYVGGEFGAVYGTAGFDFRGFFFGEFRNPGDGTFFGLLSAIVGLFFRFFFIEFDAADDGIGYSLRSFLVFGFDETGSECGDLVLVQLSFAPGDFRPVSNGFLLRLDDRAACTGRLLLSFRRLCCRCCFTFGAAVG